MTTRNFPRSIAGLARTLRTGNLTPTRLVETLLERTDTLDGELNAFRVLDRERAIRDARDAEERLARDPEAGPLVGIPYAVKDLIDVEGLPTTAGFSGLAHNFATEDAHVVRALRKAGMVLVGKTNTHQFAYGGTGINHDHGTPHNPWASEPHVPGGSSSGSAVAVAAGLVPMALGTDTGARCGSGGALRGHRPQDYRRAGRPERRIPAVSLPGFGGSPVLDGRGRGPGL